MPLAEQADRAWRALDVVVLVAITAAALWMRLPGLSHGYTGDELSNLAHAHAWQILTDVENGVNPPLLRFLFNVPFAEAHVIQYGRLFMLACSLGCVPVAAWLARLVSGGSRMAGWSAALMLAFHPIAIQHGTYFRIYPWWALTTMALAGALVKAADGDKRWWRTAAALSALLPWIHYQSLAPLATWSVALLVLVPRNRWLAAAPAMGLVSVLPMVPFVLTAADRRVAPRDTPWVLIDYLVGLALTPPRPLAMPFVYLFQDLGLERPVWPRWMGYMVGALLVVQLPLWRWLGTGRRVLLVGWIGLTAGAFALAHVQYVRDPTAIMFLAFEAPLLAALPAMLPRVWLAVPAWAGILWLLADELPGSLDERRQHAADEDGPMILAQDPGRFDDVRGDGTTWIHPSYMVPTLWYYLEGTHFVTAPVPTSCGEWRPCFEHDGRLYKGLLTEVDGAETPGVLISFDTWRKPEFGQACSPVMNEATFAAWRCGTDP